MKGIILAGGSGTRLYPLTKSISKHLLPLYDKPMIYYPLCTLMEAGIREILIISTEQDLGRYGQLLGDGSTLGISIQYALQPKPEGIAQAFIIGEAFIGEERTALILGDNVFYGPGFQTPVWHGDDALVFGAYVVDPERFGVVGFSSEGQVESIEEKPACPKSNYAVAGLYVYDSDVVAVAKSLRPSVRGELEITDINRIYLQSGKLSVRLLGEHDAWMDAGTHESLFKASQFIKTMEETKNVKIGCMEEVAFRKGWITSEELMKLGHQFRNNPYGQYLKRVAARGSKR
ncbi:glucose-1-phosphate thymidylyltransferase RfbA [Rossellomorea marisflavi]|uniref:Glucose-1-phosphate thymidylyltransferase n=1 Tax=Rossellomorea marisflavi TaxID=189381 RepID=A0A165LYK9_9BACI|nr:glucose-1-phosphate thymidylyltransferase RfbA [Rossellomorea marisflavi]KZE53334.1 glucose-1-phosphate thymidylyltransferase [Rossellomorea marisflavi]